VLIQGVGEVGEPLARSLAEAGAGLLVSDVADERAAAIAAGLGASPVEAGASIETECDVFAPCAVGGVLNEDTIPRLRCRVVAGAANNQLGEPGDAARLRSAGIVYAPDYVVNAGGVLHLAGLESLGWSRAELEQRLARIGDTVRAVLRTADEEDISTEEAAAHLVHDRLSPEAS
jgi:glutamate dehydrogenase/leucine dehydrogenase